MNICECCGEGNQSRCCVLFKQMCDLYFVHLNNTVANVPTHASTHAMVSCGSVINTFKKRNNFDVSFDTGIVRYVVIRMQDKFLFTQNLYNGGFKYI